MSDELKPRIREMLAANIMLQTPLEDLRDDQPLFGPGSLGLDSVDALQLVVALDKNFGLKITDQPKAREILRDINSITAAVATHQAST
ncbi:MAG: acyl carrier protein [Verrucomicrobia bacterium]|nr:acyl carrier protein [Verrucomicrobiota bacterium]